MSGVRGDLFASSTWFDHCICALEARGLLSGEANFEEPAARYYMDADLCLDARAREYRSKHNIFNFNERFGAVAMAEPDTYAARAKDFFRKQRENKKTKFHDVDQRHLVKNIHLNRIPPYALGIGDDDDYENYKA